MQQRRITLEDGRYLIFYTFEDETAPPATSDHTAHVKDEEAAPQAKSAEAKPQAEEERSV